MREERWKRMAELDVFHGALSQTERDLGPPYKFPNVLEKIGPDEVNLPVEWDKLEHQPGLRHRHHQPRLRNSLPHGFVSYHPPGRCPRHLDRV